jgi:cephalosporin-C deacetylase
MLKITIFYQRCAMYLLLISVSVQAFAQDSTNKEPIAIHIEADRSDWNYKVGEQPQFTVNVTKSADIKEDITLTYTFGPEKMPAFKTGKFSSNAKNFSVTGYSLKEPGFLRLEVTATVGGKKFTKLATAALSPDKIMPTVTAPADFDKFWSDAIAAVKKIPLNPKVELMKDYSTAEVDVYHVNFNNINGSKVYGMLSVPKAPGKYPAALRVPGAGIRAYKGDVNTASKGVITLEIGIHGMPVNLDKGVYDDLRSGALNSYQMSNLDDKNRYYYYRVYLGCIKALDFLTSHEKYDGSNLAVYGGSQGGALSIVTAALDPRVKYLAAYYPALSDVTGTLFNRAGGWPHLFVGRNKSFNDTPAKLETVKYYDVVNFAKRLKVPGFYSWGYNDLTCPPTSMHAAYNVITAPKELVIYKETGHNTVTEQRNQFDTWLLNKLKP